MSYEYGERKVVAVLASTLAPGVAVNVVGHLCVAVGRYGDSQLMGRPILEDGSGVEHVGIARYPVIITKVRPGRLRRFIEEARAEPELLLVDYPQEMLDTGHDDELAERLAAATEGDIEYLGAIVYGPASVVTALSGKFTLYS